MRIVFPRGENQAQISWPVWLNVISSDEHLRSGINEAHSNADLKSWLGFRTLAATRAFFGTHKYGNIATPHSYWLEVSAYTFNHRAAPVLTTEENRPNAKFSYDFFLSQTCSEVFGAAISCNFDDSRQEIEPRGRTN
jgi:hypothetical protein